MSDESKPQDVLLPVEGRVIAISGASRGLGKAIAQRLYAEGYRLSLGVRDPARTLSTLGFDRERVSAHVYDAERLETADRWIDETVAHHGRLDGLVNNAGIFRMVTFAEGSEDDLDEMWRVNVKGPFRTLKRALPHLRATGRGRIVNIASTDGKRIRDGSISLGYAMSKHAVVALSHAAKFDGWDDGLRVTAICPGAIETGMIATVRSATAAPGRLQPGTVAEIISLLMRLPNSATVAELVVNTRLESTI